MSCYFRVRCCNRCLFRDRIGFGRVLHSTYPIPRAMRARRPHVPAPAQLSGTSRIFCRPKAPTDSFFTALGYCLFLNRLNLCGQLCISDRTPPHTTATRLRSTTATRQFHPLPRQPNGPLLLVSLLVNNSRGRQLSRPPPCVPISDTGGRQRPVHSGLVLRGPPLTEVAQ